MTEAQIKYLKNYPTADYLLKHKDAVGLCLQILKAHGIEVEQKELQEICGQYGSKCYIRSKSWIGDK